VFRFKISPMCMNRCIHPLDTKRPRSSKSIMPGKEDKTGGLPVHLVWVNFGCRIYTSIAQVPFTNNYLLVYDYMLYSLKGIISTILLDIISPKYIIYRYE
jgi:hypothetical protein